VSSSYESAARLLWDPGRWSSPDLDLVSNFSSLSIASSFHDDLHVEALSFPLLNLSAAGSVLEPAIPSPLMDAVPARVLPVFSIVPSCKSYSPEQSHFLGCVPVNVVAMRHWGSACCHPVFSHAPLFCLVLALGFVFSLWFSFTVFDIQYSIHIGMAGVSASQQWRFNTSAHAVLF
jgi:hypothetical protein